MSEIAVELARRAEPERLKTLAKEKGAELKEKAKDKAQVELESLKARAKEKAMDRTIELKDRFVESPRRSYAGALLGAGVGYWAFKKFVHHRGGARQVWTAGEVEIDRDYAVMGADLGVPPKEESSLKDRARDLVGNVKERATDAAHAVQEKAGDLRERAAGLKEELPSRSELRQQSASYWGRLTQQQPILLAVGALALGVLTSLLIPVTDRERRLIAPAKERMQSQVIDPAMSKVQSAVDRAGEAVEQKLQPQPEGPQGDSATVVTASAEGIERELSPAPQTVTSGTILPPTTKV